LVSQPLICGFVVVPVSLEEHEQAGASARSDSHGVRTRERIEDVSGARVGIEPTPGATPKNTTNRPSRELTFPGARPPNPARPQKYLFRLSPTQKSPKSKAFCKNSRTDPVTVPANAKKPMCDKICYPIKGKKRYPHPNPHIRTDLPNNPTRRDSALISRTSYFDRILTAVKNP